MDVSRLERVFADALRPVSPPLELEVHGPDDDPSTVIALLNGRPIRIAWLPAGWPAQVRELLSRTAPPDLVGAPELSAGARKLLDEHGVSWFDGTGAAQIRVPGLQIYTDSSRTFDRPPRRNLGWTAATLAVAEALLVGEAGAVTDVSRTTGLALSTVAASLKFLQGEHLLEAKADRGRNARRHVSDPDDLLAAYAAAATRMRTPESIRVGVLWRDTHRGARQLGTLWDEASIRWSVTGALAADLIAPLLTEIAPMEIYVQAKSRAELREVAFMAGVEESAGGRLLLRPFPTPADDALSHVDQGIRRVCWPRAYADLRAAGVRGEDAAEHLRDVMMTREDTDARS